jgi:hypothetical protein
MTASFKVGEKCHQFAAGDRWQRPLGHDAPFASGDQSNAGHENPAPSSQPSSFAGWPGSGASVLSLPVRCNRASAPAPVRGESPHEASI